MTYSSECRWWKQKDGYWRSECGLVEEFGEGHLNSWCPKCSRRIVLLEKEGSTHD